MKLFLCAALFCASLAVTSVADAGQVRAAAILTTADVVSTWTLPRTGDPDYYDVWATFTIGSLTNCDVVACGAYLTSPSSTSAGITNGGPAAAGYGKKPNNANGTAVDSTTSYTLTATGTYLLRFPKSAFGDYTFRGVFAKGNGTVTNSSLTLYVANTPTSR